MKDKMDEVTKFITLHGPILEERVREAVFGYFLDRNDPETDVDLQLIVIVATAAFLSAYSELVAKHLGLTQEMFEVARNMGVEIGQASFEEEFVDPEELITMPGGDA